MSETKTAPTAHGNVEYETVKCTSCENTVAKETAHRFVIGEYYGTDRWSFKPYDKVKMDEYAKGWVCEYCADDPVQYPSLTVDDTIIGFSIGVVSGIVLMAMLTFAF